MLVPPCLLFCSVFKYFQKIRIFCNNCLIPLLLVNTIKKSILHREFETFYNKSIVLTIFYNCVCSKRNVLLLISILIVNIKSYLNVLNSNQCQE